MMSLPPTKINLKLSPLKLSLGEHADWNTSPFGPHNPRTGWIYDAKTGSPRTCERCLEYERRYNPAHGGRILPGSWIPLIFPWHYHIAVNQIKPYVHKHCRCNLWWVGGVTIFPDEWRKLGYENPVQMPAMRRML